MNFTDPTIAEINAYIRFWLGDVTVGLISDETLDFMIQLVIDRDPSYTVCDVIYYSTIEVLTWLVRKQETGTTAGTGDIKKRSEKIGGVDVSVEYDVGVNSSGSGGWRTVLDDLKSNPDSIGCIVTRDSVAEESSGSVIFGGINQKEYDRVKRDPDSKNGWSVRSPFRSHLK